MLGFIKRLFFGMSAGVMGLAYLLITVLDSALYIYTVYFAYFIKGFFAAFRTFFFPFFSQIMWVIVIIFELLLPQVQKTNKINNYNALF